MGSVRFGMRRQARWRHAATVLALSTAFPALAADLSAYSDFGRPDIAVTAAYISQAGSGNRARIEQVFVTSPDADAEIDPVGTGNIAQIVQDGLALRGQILQSGNLNRARLTQTGTDNEATISQIGSGNTVDLVQEGSGNVADTAQDGVGNSITLKQVGGGLASLRETGNFNSIVVEQSLSGPPVSVNLVGDRLTVTIRQ